MGKLTFKNYSWFLVYVLASCLANKTDYFKGIIATQFLPHMAKYLKIIPFPVSKFFIRKYSYRRTEY